MTMKEHTRDVSDEMMDALRDPYQFKDIVDYVCLHDKELAL